MSALKYRSGSQPRVRVLRYRISSTREQTRTRIEKRSYSAYLHISASYVGNGVSGLVRAGKQSV